MNLLLLSLSFLVSQPEKVTFNDGDRIVFLGSTLIEREQQHGYWEEAITRSHRGKSLIFRNLAWSGDTVRGESRAAFDPPAKGYERLLDLTKEAKPSVIICSYGSNESFGGEKELETFRKNYEKLMSDLAVTKAKFVLMTPIPFENGPGMGDVAGKNRSLAQYCDTIRSIATAKNLGVIDLFNHCTQAKLIVTENGLHPAAKGYRELAKVFGDGEVNEPLRKLIVEKNELFFHRWRPQNETYLFGFRKHEQGKNGKEIVEFDPLIEAKEKAIRELLK